MSVNVNEQKIQSLYDTLSKHPEVVLNSDLASQLAEWQGGKWRTYLEAVLGRLPVSLRDKIVLDFGCKYGLLAPLLLELGSKKVYGIENAEDIIAPARRLFHPPEWEVEFMRSEQGYIPLQPETVDIVIVNEVISHINPSYLPVVYNETSRILTSGGIFFISDDNNVGCPSYHSNYLTSIYEAIENGPDGAKIGHVTVQTCLCNQRKEVIRSRHPELTQEQIEYASRNTSGLFGDYLYKVIDRFAETGHLVRRPYRRGMSPAYPETGQVEERGFYPEQVVFDLMEYGFKSTIVNQAYRFPFSNGRLPVDRALIKPAAGYGRFSYQFPIPEECAKGDQLALLEDDKPLPLPTDDHSEIAGKGMGRYSVWRSNGSVYFSSTDNSDPRSNDRKYELYWTRADSRTIYGSPNFQIVAVKQ